MNQSPVSICPSLSRYQVHTRNSPRRHWCSQGVYAKRLSTDLAHFKTDFLSSQLVATLHQAQAVVTRVSAPVKIERFDNLSTWDIFQVPRLVEVVGSDHTAQMNVVLPVTCIGPLDPIMILVNIAPNSDWPTKARKIRVNKIQVFHALGKISPHFRYLSRKSSRSNLRPVMRWLLKRNEYCAQSRTALVLNSMYAATLSAHVYPFIANWHLQGDTYTSAL